MCASQSASIIERLERAIASGVSVASSNSGTASDLGPVAAASDDRSFSGSSSVTDSQTGSDSNLSSPALTLVPDLASTSGSMGEPDTTEAMGLHPANSSGQTSRTGISVDSNQPVTSSDPPGTIEKSESKLSGPALARQTLGAMRKAKTASKKSAEQDRENSVEQSESSAISPLASLHEPDQKLSSEQSAGSPLGAETAPAVSNSEHQAPGKPDRDTLVQAWGDHVLAKLSGRARARFKMGRFVAVESDAAVFSLPNETHRSYCEEVKRDVETVLAEHFGTKVPLRLVVVSDDSQYRSSDGSGSDPGQITTFSESEQDLLDPNVLAAETNPAGAAMGAADRLKEAFPGAKEV